MATKVPNCVFVLLPLAIAAAAAQPVPGLRVSPLLIDSGDAVSVLSVGITPRDGDAIAAYYAAADPSNESAYDFYRSVLQDPAAPPFVRAIACSGVSMQE